MPAVGEGTVVCAVGRYVAQWCVEVGAIMWVRVRVRVRVDREGWGIRRHAY